MDSLDVGPSCTTISPLDETTRPTMARALIEADGLDTPHAVTGCPRLRHC